jgi:hypothetical protein
MICTQILRPVLRRAFLATFILAAGISIATAQEASPDSFTFTTFTVPNAVTLSVESINDSGTASGYYSDAAGDVISFLRAYSGTQVTYQDPLDTVSPTFTEGGQINNNGVVVGEYLNTAAGTYEGYFYKTATKTFGSYQVPGQPQFTTTSLAGINTAGNVCGYVFPPPYTAYSAFVESAGTVTMFSVEGSAATACLGLNDAGTAVGFYVDSAGVSHGWMRTSSGTVTTIDVPGAATTPGTAPCIQGPVAGSLVLGVNNSGYVSGHYWDSAYNEHGFIRTPAGKFVQINVPGAYQTGGGGLNDKLVMVGHYEDSSCNYSGFVAIP